jgi:hypothetical protein
LQLRVSLLTQLIEPPEVVVLDAQLWIIRDDLKGQQP